MNPQFWLTMQDLEGKRTNMHTHTKRCRHAAGEDREYVEKAIEAGYEVLGFSDHTPQDYGKEFVSPIRMSFQELDGYVDSIQRLKEEYQNDITIYCGLEAEYFPVRFDETRRALEGYPIDYMLLGQHYFNDEIGQIYVGRRWPDEEHLKLYVDRILEGLKTECFLYVAHPDIINYTGEDAIYYKHMKKIADELKKRNIPIEVNVGGYAERRQYPNPKFIQLGIENQNHFIIGVDAHAPEELIDYDNYKKCLQLVTEKGGRLI